MLLFGLSHQFLPKPLSSFTVNNPLCLAYVVIYSSQISLAFTLNIVYLTGLKNLQSLNSNFFTVHQYLL